MNMLLLITIGIGIVVGVVGGLITKSKSYGLLINIGSGIVGSIIAYWAISQIFFNFEDDRFKVTMLASLFLSIIIVWVIALLRRKG